MKTTRRGLFAAAGAAGAALAAGPALAQAGRAAPDAVQTASTSVAATRAAVPGPNGVISAGHPLAASAGLQMMLKGGSAADAAVAALAALNVCEPWASSAAGNGFGIVRDPKTGEVRSLNYAGAAPALLESAKVTKEDLDWGPKAACTPGAFGGWIELLRKYGRLSLAETLAPAIALARDGHAVDPSIAQFISRAASRLALYETSKAIYLPGGAAPKAFDLFRNEPLAKTFEKLAAVEAKALKGGASRDEALLAANAEFYTGSIGYEIGRFHQKAGGYLRAADLKAYRATWSEPVSTTYRGYAVYSSPTTSRGGLEMCLQLNLLERFELAGLKQGGAQVVHLMAEAIKAAKAEIYPYVADPKFFPTPTDILLSKAFAADRAGLIDPARAAVFAAPTDLRRYSASAPVPVMPKPDMKMASSPGDTTSLSVVDKDGLVVCCTPTLGGGFGTGVVAGSTGLLLNNGMRHGSTSPYPGTANFVRPGQIPILNNSPTLVTKDGRFEIVLGSPGGETIGQTQFQVLVNVLDFGMEVQPAIEAPRFTLDAEPNFYMPGAEVSMMLESRFDPAVVQALAGLGHKVRSVGPYAAGSIQSVKATSWGGKVGGADPRRTAAAAGY